MRSSTPSPLPRALFVIARHLCSQTSSRRLAHFVPPSLARSSLPLLGPSSKPKRIQSRTLISGIGFTPPPLGPSLVLIVVSLFAAILLDARGSSCGAASRSASPRSRVRGVVRCSAAHRRSSSSLSPRFLSP
jgi:hypothetical protein